MLWNDNNLANIGEMAMLRGLEKIDALDWHVGARWAIGWETSGQQKAPGEGASCWEGEPSVGSGRKSARRIGALHVRQGE